MRDMDQQFLLPNKNRRQIKPLKHGLIRDCKGSQKSRKYILVPKGWIPPDESTFLEQIFRGLGLAQPSLIFRTMKCANFVPNYKADQEDECDEDDEFFKEDGDQDKEEEDVDEKEGDKSAQEESGKMMDYIKYQGGKEDQDQGEDGDQEGERVENMANDNEDEEEGQEESGNKVRLVGLKYGEKSATTDPPPSAEQVNHFELVMNSRIENFLRNLSNACAQLGAYYLLDHATSSNEFDKLLLKTLPHNGVAVAQLKLWNEKSKKIGGKIREHVLTSKPGWKHAVEYLVTYATSLDEDVEKEVIWELDLLPEIEHLIVFEGAEELKRFRRLMYRDVPVGLLAAGGTHALLDEGLKCLRDGRPLFIFEHTIRAGHCLASLMAAYEERQKEIHKANNNEELTGMEDPSRYLKKLCFGHEEVVVYGKENHSNPYQLLSRMYDMVEKFNLNFPLNFNNGAVMVIDPLKDAHLSEMTDKITDVMTSIYDDVPEIGGDEAEKDIVTQAESVVEHLGRLEAREKVIAWILRWIILVIAFLITLLSVIYEYITRKAITDSSVTHLLGLLRILTIVLPIVLAVSLTINTTFSPVLRYSRARLARARVERALYRYRCRIGKYHALIGEGPIHRQNFTMELKSILDKVRESDLVRYSMYWKIDDKSFYRTGIIQRVDPNEPTCPKQIPEWTDENGCSYSPCLEYLESDGQGCRNYRCTMHHFAPNTVAKWTPQQWKDMDNTVKVSGNIKYTRNWNFENRSKTISRILGEKRHLLLTTEEYINMRLLPNLPLLSRKVARLSWRLRLLQCALILLSSSTAIMSAYNQQLWNPTVLAFVALLEGFREFYQLPKQVESINITIARLREIILWWKGLPVLNKKLPNMKELLVDSVENAILDRIVNITDSILTAETQFESEHDNSKRKNPVVGTKQGNQNQNQNENAKDQPV